MYRKPTVEDYDRSEDDFPDMDDEDHLSTGYEGIMMQIEELQEKRHKLRAVARKLEASSSAKGDAQETTIKTGPKRDREDGEDKEDDDVDDMLDSFDVKDLSFQETQGLIARLLENVNATEAKIKKLSSNKKLASAVASKISVNIAKVGGPSSSGKKLKSGVTATQAANPGASGHKVTKAKAKAKSSPRPTRKGVARPVKK